MTVLTAFGSADLERDNYELGASILSFSSSPRAAVSAHGMPGCAFRVSDDASLSGLYHGGKSFIECQQGAGSLDAVIGLYRQSQSRASAVSTVQNLRFAWSRYGIITPFNADRPAGVSSPEAWYYWGEHVVRGVQGQAYERAIRISGQNTLIEDFNLHDCGGTSAEPSVYKRAIAITLQGPNPVVRNGVIRRMNHIHPDAVPEGYISEIVGISFEQDCTGGVIENVHISNPVLLDQLSIGVWVGHSQGVTVRNVEVKNMGHALYCSASPTSSGLAEGCRSFNCTYGYAWAMAQYPEWKFKDCWDLNFVNGVWTATEVSNV